MGCRAGTPSANSTIAERLHLLAADEIVGISGAITEILTRLWRLPRERICRIPNPYVPSPDLLSIPTDTQTRTVTFVGRLEVRKGWSRLQRPSRVSCANGPM